MNRGQTGRVTRLAYVGAQLSPLLVHKVIKFLQLRAFELGIPHKQVLARARVRLVCKLHGVKRVQLSALLKLLQRYQLARGWPECLCVYLLKQKAQTSAIVASLMRRTGPVVVLVRGGEAAYRLQMFTTVLVKAVASIKQVITQFVV